MPTHRHDTQSFIDFVQTLEPSKRCKECGTEDEMFLDFASERERFRGKGDV